MSSLLTKAKRVIAILLIAMMVFTLTPVLSEDMGTVEAASYTTPSNVTPAMVKKRALELKSLVGTYFTTTGKTCHTPYERHHPLDDHAACNVENVLKSNSAVRNLCKEYKGGIPSRNNLGSKISGWTCYGFGKFAMWYLFADKSTDFVDDTMVWSGTFTRENVLAHVKPGDYLRLGGTHSVVVVEVYKTGDKKGRMKVLEGNINDGSYYGNSGIYYHDFPTWLEYDYLGSSMQVYRASNFTESAWGTSTKSHGASQYISTKDGPYYKATSTDTYYYDEAGNKKTKIKEGTLINVMAVAKKNGDSDWSYCKIKTAKGTEGYIKKSALDKWKYTPNPANSGFAFSKGHPETYTILNRKMGDNIRTIKSNLPLRSITAEIKVGDNVLWHRQFMSNTTTKTFNFNSGFLYNKIKEDIKTLKVGRYTMTYWVKDIAGTESEKQTLTLIITDAEMPEFIKVNEEVGGRSVTIKQNEDDATLYYKVGGDEWNHKNKETVTTRTFSERTTIWAYSKAGNKKSATVKDSFNVPTLSAPVISDKTFIGNKHTITIEHKKSDVTILYRVNEGEYKPYTKPFTVSTGYKVEAKAQRKGYADSPVAEYTAKFINLSAPWATYAGQDTNIAVGQTATVTWDMDQNAESYTATMYDDSRSVVETIDTVDPTATFTIPAEGQYTITVKAVNSEGVSEESNPITVTGKGPLTVRFYDMGEASAKTVPDESDLISSAQVPYGGTLGEIGELSRKGHTFRGWRDLDTNDVSMDAYASEIITEDKDYMAVYGAQKYTVRLYDTTGTLRSTQQVDYGTSVLNTTATSNLESQIAAELEPGYVFKGWEVTQTKDGFSTADLSFIDADMDAHAVAVWGNAELPVVATINTVEMSNDGKYIDANIILSNSTEKDLSFYLVYALKGVEEGTGIEQTVYADRKIVNLSATGNNDSEKTIPVRIENLSDFAGKITGLEVEALECKNDQSTGSAYSSKAFKEYTIAQTHGDWSEWDVTRPEDASGREIEEKTQYRYRDKVYAYSGYETLSGYTYLSNEVISTSYGNWAAYKPSTGTEHNSSYMTVTSYESKNVKKAYAYYCDCKKVCWSNKNGTCKYCGGKTENYLTVYSSVGVKESGYTLNSTGDYTLPKTIGKNSPGKLGTIYCMYYKGSQISSFTTNAVTGEIYLWPSSTYNYTIYRSKVVKSKNKFWKWGGYSDWGDTEVTASSERQVETRTVYRYRDPIASPVQASIDFDDSQIRSFSGTLESMSDLEGKVATIMVYQSCNTDPLKFQLQHIGQTTIGTNGSYSFTFVPKDEPTVESGNYIVSLGVQGSTGLVNVGLVEAPKALHSVQLFYIDEEQERVVIDEQIVEDGSDVDLSAVTIPERAGFAFVGWKNSVTNVTTGSEGVPYEIEAFYAPVMNSVVFVDWRNQTADVQLVATNTSIQVPGAPEDGVGYTFKGWKLPDGTLLNAGEQYTVTGNAVIEAEYDLEQFTVRFLDINGEVLSTQQVNYGEAAEPPVYEVDESEGTFVGWSTLTNWWGVQEDCDVKPIILFENTTLAPTAMTTPAENGTDRELVFSSEQEDAQIYYSLSETAPTVDMIEEYILTRDGDESGPSDSYGNNSIALYTGPLTFEESTPVTAVAYIPGENISEACETYYDAEGQLEDSEFADELENEGEVFGADVDVKHGQDVIVEVKIDDNPGMAGCEYAIYADTGVFYPDFDEFDAPIIEEGQPFADGSFCTGLLEDGWDVFWSSEEDSTATGLFFRFVLHVDEECEEGTYPIRVMRVMDSTIDCQGSLVDFGEATVTIVTEEPEYGFTRIYGSNRYDTAIKAADELKDNLGVDQFDAIVVAYGQNYADALSASSLADVISAPILLIAENQEDKVSDYLDANLKSGGKVYLIGGKGVIRNEFESSLKEKGYDVERLAGSNRFGTNIAIIEAYFDNASSDEILVCCGVGDNGYADALSASSVGKPILLAGPQLTDAQKEYLAGLAAENGRQLTFTIIGGKGAVSEDVEADLSEFQTSGTPKRLSGKNRYKTSKAVAENYFGNGSDTVVLVYGQNYPDGLSAASLAYDLSAPVLLASSDDNNNEPIAEIASALGAKNCIVLGGPKLISDEAVNNIMGFAA